MTVPGCYRCQLGDPHTTHETSEEVFGNGDEARIDEATGMPGGESAASDRITCDLPETRWPPFDPLYIAGGSQCPDCNRHDLNEEATRNHAEVNA